MNLRVCYVCLCSVGIFSWCGYEQETQHAAEPEALADTYAPTGCREKKKEGCLFSRVMSRELRKSFFWRQEAYLFRHALITLPVRAPPAEKLLFFYSFVLFPVYFIFYVIGFFISYLIPPPQHQTRKCCQVMFFELNTIKFKNIL